MAGTAESINDLRAQRFGFTASHQTKFAGTFDRSAVPRCNPNVARFTQPDSDLLRVRNLRMNRKPQRPRETIAQQTPPGVASLHHPISQVFAFNAHLGAALLGLYNDSIFKQKPLDPIKQ